MTSAWINILNWDWLQLTLDTIPWLNAVNITTSIVLTLCFSYQFFYIILAIFAKPKKFRDVEPTHRYAIMISARNEQNVIGHLIDSILANDYPQELIDIYVVADNCTDSTAELSRSKGALVYERFNNKLLGKGYALDFLLKNIDKEKGLDYYDGYFVFDADNLLDKHYITEMDKCFSEGSRIITSYRNSKNYGSNWISAGYALWFIREARYLNNPRFLLNTSCAVSGTGFLVHRDIIKKQGGWKHFLLTEDIEFSIDNVIQGEKVGYCHSAMLYDEQPTSFKQSWRQRLRWSKGFLQVISKYGLNLLKNIFALKGFSSFDMLMTIAPAFFITVSNFFINFGALVYSLVFEMKYALAVTIGMINAGIGAYALLFIVGIVTIIGEWKQIHCTTSKKIASIFTFPFFILTYIPISIQALFTKVEWKPIEHTYSVSMDEIEKESQ